MSSAVDPEPSVQRTANGVVHRVFGDGAPLLLFHGGAGNWEHWRRNAPVLGQAFRVSAIDLPSYGDSDAVPWDTPVADYLDHVEDAVRDIIGTAPHVHLAGFSFGGFIAADMAVRLGDRMAALSMTGGAGYGRPEGRGFTLDSRKRARERLGREPTDDEFRAMQADNLGKLMLWDRNKIDDQAIEMQIRNVNRTRFDSRRLSWSDGTPQRIGQLRCPVLVVYGEHDAAAVPPIDERLARCRAERPDVQSHIIPDCGHWAMYEAPETVNQLLLDFHGGGA